MQALLDDESIQLFLIAAAPENRAELSIKAMQHGKDVMLDKPGCLTQQELNRIRATVIDTGRIWSVNFSERFEVPAVTKADELLAQGRIGQVVQTISMGPHRLNAPTRPEWFWEPSRYGGILGDIGTHQIDQFLHFCKATEARIVSSAVGNFAHPDTPLFQDFGEVNMASDRCQGYARLDWFTPDALPTWGDGRLTLLGTEGYIELRKYLDVTHSNSTDHVYLVNHEEQVHLDASDAGTPYFQRFADDLLNRTETACSQAHTLKVMELAITAQANAERRGHLV
jgi:predicted dehydrogenase